MKKFIIWFLAFIITTGAAYYQRKTGPTYPKKVQVTLNGNTTDLKLVRSLGLDERSEVRLAIKDTSIRAVLYYKRFKTGDEYSQKTFMKGESGLFAEIPQQPTAGKLQYYIEITDSETLKTIMKETPVVLRYKGEVPGIILIPHILIMFIAMLFSTGAGLLAAVKIPSYRKYGTWTLILLAAGGMILGPIVQNYAFGELWTGIPFGWDLTDNKTLIAFLLWILAVFMNYKKERPFYTILAAVGLLIVFSIPHSLFGSELDYATGQVTQGIIFIFFFISQKNY